MSLLLVFFLLITTALACHLLQCSAHATIFSFRFLRQGRGKQDHVSRVCGIMRVGERADRCHSRRSLCSLFCFFVFFLIASALSHCIRLKNELRILRVKHSQESAMATLLLKAAEHGQPFELSHQKRLITSFKVCFFFFFFLNGTHLCLINECKNPEVSSEAGAKIKRRSNFHSFQIFIFFFQIVICETFGKIFIFLILRPVKTRIV